MSTISPRNGIVPSRPITIAAQSTQQTTVPPTSQPAAAQPVEALPHRFILPTRYMELEPARPLTAINDDPLFNTRSAATVLGVSVEAMKKWRQRSQGPDY